MWTPQYDIIIETLTGSEFEITVSAKDTVGYIKSRIQKHEGMYLWTILKRIPKPNSFDPFEEVFDKIIFFFLNLIFFLHSSAIF